MPPSLRKHLWSSTTFFFNHPTQHWIPVIHNLPSASHSYNIIFQKFKNTSHTKKKSSKESSRIHEKNSLSFLFFYFILIQINLKYFIFILYLFLLMLFIILLCVFILFSVVSGLLLFNRQKKYKTKENLKERWITKRKTKVKETPHKKFEIITYKERERERKKGREI